VSEAVRNLTVDATNTTASVMWVPPRDANGIISSYQVNLTSPIASTFSNMQVVPGMDGILEANFSGLLPFVKYTVSVQPFTSSNTIAGITNESNFTTEIGSEWSHANPPP
jgi:hypothetical protein